MRHSIRSILLGGEQMVRIPRWLIINKCTIVSVPTLPLATRVQTIRSSLRRNLPQEPDPR